MPPFPSPFLSSHLSLSLSFLRTSVVEHQKRRNRLGVRAGEAGAQDGLALALLLLFFGQFGRRSDADDGRARDLGGGGGGDVGAAAALRRLRGAGARGLDRRLGEDERGAAAAARDGGGEEASGRARYGELLLRCWFGFFFRFRFSTSVDVSRLEESTRVSAPREP